MICSLVTSLNVECCLEKNLRYTTAHTHNNSDFFFLFWALELGLVGTEDTCKATPRIIQLSEVAVHLERRQDKHSLEMGQH